MTKQAESAAEQLAQALLLEQVQFFKQNLSLQQSPVYIQHIVQLILSQTQQFSLQDFIELEQLHAVVKRYAFEMQLGSGLLELIGELSQSIYMTALKSPAHLQDLMSDHQFETWLSKFLELKNVRMYQHHFLKNSPAVEQLCQHLAATVLQHKIPLLFNNRTPLPDDIAANNWQTRIKRFSIKQQQNVSQKLEEQLAHFIQEQISELSLLSNDDLEGFFRHFWEDAKYTTLYEHISHLNPLDVEEFFVLIYEYWKELRQSEFIQTLVLHGVEVFYEINKDYTIEEILKSVGLTENDLVVECLRFYPKIINILDQNGLLEPLITSLLQPFYMRTQTLNLIQTHLPPTTSNLDTLSSTKSSENPR